VQGETTDIYLGKTQVRSVIYIYKKYFMDPNRDPYSERGSGTTMGIQNTKYWHQFQHRQGDHRITSPGPLWDMWGRGPEEESWLETALFSLCVAQEGEEEGEMWGTRVKVRSAAREDCPLLPPGPG
jgi:hypothetical protein